MFKSLGRGIRAYRRLKEDNFAGDRCELHFCYHLAWFAVRMIDAEGVTCWGGAGSNGRVTLPWLAVTSFVFLSPPAAMYWWLRRKEDALRRECPEAFHNVIENRPGPLIALQRLRKEVAELQQQQRHEQSQEREPASPADEDVDVERRLEALEKAIGTLERLMEEDRIQQRMKQEMKEESAQRGK